MEFLVRVEGWELGDHGKDEVKMSAKPGGQGLGSPAFIGRSRVPGRECKSSWGPINCNIQEDHLFIQQTLAEPPWALVGGQGGRALAQEV